MVPAERKEKVAMRSHEEEYLLRRLARLLREDESSALSFLSAVRISSQSHLL